MGKKLHASTAGKLLGVTARTVERWYTKYREKFFRRSLRTLGGHLRIDEDDVRDIQVAREIGRFT